MLPFAKYITDEEGGSGLADFVRVVIDAFFDNDLLWTVKTFLAHAKGSFGLCVTSSQSAHRQLCIASRGQTNSIAFFPKSGIITYGEYICSEIFYQKCRVNVLSKRTQHDAPCPSYVDIAHSWFSHYVVTLFCLFTWLYWFRVRASSRQGRLVLSNSWRGFIQLRWHL